MTRTTGMRGEAVAVLFLRLHGWRVVARNWRGGGGEIDVVAVRGRTVAICEVKTRADPRGLVEPVAHAQAGRLARAAGAFLAAHPGLACGEVRMDLVTVSGRGLRRRVRHHPGGLEAPGGSRGPGVGSPCAPSGYASDRNDMR